MSVGQASGLLFTFTILGFIWNSATEISTDLAQILQLYSCTEKLGGDALT